jgi:ABC-type oligopeptide transport system ATPase subunit
MQLPKIIITGQPGTGKSTIGMIILRALEEAGLKVELHGEDTHPDALVEYQAARVEGLKHRQALGEGPVVVEYQQLRRAPLAPKVDSPLDRETEILRKAEQFRGPAPEPRTVQVQVSTVVAKAPSELEKNVLQEAINNALKEQE